MEYGISFQDLLQKVDDENYNTPGGKARNHDMEITVRTIGKYSNIDDIKKVVIANHNGKAVYIGDVADVLTAGKMKTPSPVPTACHAL